MNKIFRLSRNNRRFDYVQSYENNWGNRPSLYLITGEVRIRDKDYWILECQNDNFYHQIVEKVME